MGKTLTKKEIDFCCLAASLGNTAEAAYKAGYTVFPAKKAEKLIRKTEIAEKIEKIKEQNRKSEEAVTGLRRLAFGNSADAVELAINFENISDIHSLDLFCISELKCNFGKGVEIKFYDRLKALEKLSEIEASGNNVGALSIYEALSRSAQKEE